jgi:hypothetical protein
MKPPAGTVKKTYNLPPALVRRVRRILGVETETEAVILALREMAFMDDVDRALAGTSGRLPRFKALR